MTQALSRQMQRAVPYHLVTARTVIGAGVAGIVTVQIPGDADFECRYINAQFTSNLLTMQITDSGTRLQILSQAALIALVSGVGQQPYVLPQPALFVRNSNVEFAFLDLSGAPNTVQVVLCGFLLYPAPNPSGQ